MKKYSGVALHVIVFVFLFIFLRIFSEYHFYCVEQNQLFQLTPIFIIDKLMQPGGLAMVLSGCLVQFFILPNVGAMITAALLTSLGALFWVILKRIDPPKPWYFIGLGFPSYPCCLCNGILITGFKERSPSV